MDTAFSTPDIFAGAVASLMILVGGMIVTRRSREQRVLMLALFIMIIAAFANASSEMFLYGWGDALAYHYEGMALGGALTSNSTGLGSASPFYLLAGDTTQRIISLSSLMHYVFFNSFLVVTLVFSLISFYGRVCVYRFFVTYYPEPSIRNWWRLGILFFPSFVFWSTGILKDGLGVFGMGVLLLGMRQFLRRPGFKSMIIAAFGAYVMLLFRDQMLLALVIAVVPWVIGETRSRAGERGGSVLLRWLVRIVLVLLIAAAIPRISAQDKTIDINDISGSLATERKGYTGTIGGSTLESTQLTDTSLTGELKQGPNSIIYALYRPFPWEVRNPLQAVAAIENLVLLILSLRMIRRLWQVRGLASSCWKSPLFQTSVLFVLMVAFALGTSTPNLGTISRYRAPLIPFFVAVLAIVQLRYEQRRSAVAAARAEARTESTTSIAPSVALSRSE